MKKFLFTALAVLWLAVSNYAQQPLNTVLLSHVNEYPTRDYNDCWGYVDANGREYAIIGVEHGTAFYDITNPLQPVNVGFIPGPTSIWRDIKTHSHYAYITTEGTGTGQGLQIVNLANLPTGVTLANTVSTWFNRAHNLYIHNGYAYIVGTNSGGGMHILDLTDPVNPVRKSYYTASGYIHDVYVWNDTAYASSEDTYDLVDIRNKTAPVRINQSAALPGIYAHSGWLTEDKRFFIACEEFDERDVTIWDLSDRSSWNLSVANWQTSENTPVHNVFVKGNFAHISYYKSGYVVLDVTNPTTPLLVGQYDTYSSTSGTYAGSWGVYPYLPSGNIIVSDINSGLYIVDFTLDNTTPVELATFSHSLLPDGVELLWETASETNNRGFEILKSYDNEEFFVIGYVAGTGNTAERSAYKFTDKDIIADKVYYKLKQYDFNGAAELFGPLAVESASLQKNRTFSLYDNYPNPFNPSTEIRYRIEQTGEVLLRVYDVLGKQVAELVNGIQSGGEYSVQFTAAGLSSGVYIYELRSGASVLHKKMSLMK